jgi:5-formaminoimidazole-4-carboxamide-1-(beta)-D-ribofuranosyl 5'-monophosphate synthetase
MIDPGRMGEVATSYGREVRVGAVASHSALDIFDGAVTEGFRTVALAQRGRDLTYRKYFQAHRDANGAVRKGCVDEVRTWDRFDALLAPAVREDLRRERVILVPNRALSSYVDLSEIEENLDVPLLGSRALLRLEERSEKENYYALLGRAGIPHPPEVPDPDRIDDLVIVKLPHAVKRLERGFFTCASPEEYRAKGAELQRLGVIRPEDLRQARIERYILGPVFNFNFFYSPLAPPGESLELLGVDERRESSLDGLVRLPAEQQLALPLRHRIPEYTVVGHGTLTVRESLLEEAFRLGERFVEEARRSHPPGVIGPFCLQTCVDRDGRLYVFDVAVRIGGGTNIHMSLGHPYGNTLWRVPMSSGRRLARELREAIAQERLREVVT